MTMNKVSNSLYLNCAKPKSSLQENFAELHKLFRLKACIFLQAVCFFEVKKVELKILIQNFLSFD